MNVPVQIVSRRVLSLLATAGTLMLAAAGARGVTDPQYQPVIIENDPAAGFSDGSQIVPSLSPAISRTSGRIAYAADLAINPDLSIYPYNSGVAYTGMPTEPSLLLHVTDPAPGFPVDWVFGGRGFYNDGTDPDVPISGHYDLLPNGERTLVYATTRGPRPARSIGLYLHTPATGMNLILKKGDAAPGAGAGTTFAFGAYDFAGGNYAMNSVGQIAFGNDLAGTGVFTSTTFSSTPPFPVQNQKNSNGIWGGTPGNFQKLARSGDPAPGTEAGTVYEFTNTRVCLNDNGVYAYSAPLRVSGKITGPNNNAVYTGTLGGAGPSLLMRTGQPAPGIADGTLAGSFGVPTLNNAGKFAVRGQYTGGSVAGTKTRDALFVGTPGNMQLVLQAGTTAPGISADPTSPTPDNIIFKIDNPIITGDGRVYVRVSFGQASITTENSAYFALYEIKGPGDLGPLCGSYTPLLPEFATDDFLLWDTFEIQANALGQVVFRAFTLRKNPTTGLYGISTSPQTLVALNPDGKFYIIASTELSFPPISGGVNGDIQPFSVYTNGGTGGTTAAAEGGGGEDGRTTSLFSNSRVAFIVNDDITGSGMYIAKWGDRCNLADVAGLDGTPIPDGQLSASDVVVFFTALFNNNLDVADIAVQGGGDGQDNRISADDIVKFFANFFAPCLVPG